jgi:hypothetical protein
VRRAPAAAAAPFESVAVDTYPYFDFLLDGRKVWREPYHGCGGALV